MKFKLIFFLLALTNVSCKNNETSPNSASEIYKTNTSTNNKSFSKFDSTIVLVETCTHKNYKAKLLEYIGLDSNAFKLTLTQNNLDRVFILNLRPGRTNIDSCRNSYITLSSSCGLPCYGVDFVFVNENRPTERYMFCHISENNENIITHIENEQFEMLSIRNLANSKEIKVKISPCENAYSYPCGINKLRVVQNKLVITFDTPEDKPRIKEIDISEILN